MKKLKGFLFASVLSLLVSSVGFSEVCLTDEEFQIIMTSLNEAETILMNNEILMTTLNQITKGDAQLLAKSDKVISQQSEVLDSLEKYYKKLRLERTIILISGGVIITLLTVALIVK